MKKEILASLLAAGMIVSQTPAVMAKGRTVSVLTKISYDAHYAFYNKSSTEYRYNKKGLIATETDHWSGSIFRGNNRYYYNKNNKIVKEVSYLSSPKIKTTLGDYHYNKKGQLISEGKGKDRNQFTYKNNRLTSIKLANGKEKYYYNKKGQLQRVKTGLGTGTTPSYVYDARGYLKVFKGACFSKGPITFKNTYRNGLLVKQNYRYQSNGYVDDAEGKIRKGKIVYHYKKIHVSSSVYRHVKNQQATLYYVGDGDYYASGFLTYFIYNA